ncbi:MAG: AI-2E family transporter [Spirochaetales bacterium]|nr:AI-2E family transporter [Spirochaetales bacterium]MCP5484499.1 AI-2E family transporter [Spirochaetales bacterium]
MDSQESEPKADQIPKAPPKELPVGIRTLHKDRIVPYLAALLLIGASLLVFLVYRSYAWPTFFALLVYVGFIPVNKYLTRLCRGNRNLAALLTTLLVILAIVAPTALLVRHLISQVYDLVILTRDSLTGERLVFTLQRFPLLTDFLTSSPFFWVDLHSSLQEIGSGYTRFLDTDSIGSWVGGVFVIVKGSLTLTLGLLFNLLLGLIILFFLFRDGPLFYEFLEQALPFPQELTERFVTRMRDLITTVLRGNVFVSILQGTAVGLGLTICGFSNAAVYGFIAGIFSLIPVIGTAFVWFPAMLYLALVEESYGLALFIAIFGLSAYLILENIFKPKLMDRKLGMHPLFLFLAILGGIAEFGPSGVVLGPLFVTLFMTIWSIYHIWDSQPHPKPPAST